MEMNRDKKYICNHTNEESNFENLLIKIAIIFNLIEKRKFEFECGMTFESCVIEPHKYLINKDSKILMNINTHTVYVYFK